MENSCSGTYDANSLANSTRVDSRSDMFMITGGFSETTTLGSEEEVESSVLRVVWEAG